MNTAFEKTEDPRFVRDKRTGAILNNDKEGYRHFLEERRRILQTQALAQEVTTLKTELSDIKMLLQQLINGK
jgi:hypothetical protein